MRFRVLILTVLVMTCVVRLHASPQPSDNDPRLIINGGHEPIGSSAPVGLDFSFMADASGGGLFSFMNTSGQNWTFLEIEAPSPNPSYVITCGGTSFATCVVLPQPGDFTIIDFSGGGGILNGQGFTIDLGSSGWPPNGVFHAFANPEPGTLGLCLIGLAPLLARRLNQFGAKNR